MITMIVISPALGGGGDVNIDDRCKGHVSRTLNGGQAPHEGTSAISAVLALRRRCAPRGNPMATGLADDPKRWRDRAQEARARAGDLNDPVAKRQMLGIARGYDRLAKRAEERSRPTALPPDPLR
jgi:hypothetical protein